MLILSLSALYGDGDFNMLDMVSQMSEGIGVNSFTVEFLMAMSGICYVATLTLYYWDILTNSTR